MKKKRKKDLCEVRVSKHPFRGCYRKRTSIKAKEGEREREREKKGREEDEKRTRRRETNLVVTL